jgi:hypothetical protein
MSVKVLLFAALALTALVLVSSTGTIDDTRRYQAGLTMAP